MTKRQNTAPRASIQLTTGEVATRIQAARPRLVRSAEKVVDVIIDNPDAVLDSSVSDVADRAGTSESTVIRASQALGFKGFHDLKLTLASDLATQRRDNDDLEHPEGIGPRTPRADIPRLILRNSSRALQDAVHVLDLDAFAHAVDALTEARRILVVGNVSSTATAQDTAYRLSTLGLVVHAPTDAFGQDLAARALDNRDVFLGISRTGATKETLNAAESAHRSGARIIAVTSHLRSPLTAQAHHTLIAGGPALVPGGADLSFRQEAMTSRLTHLAILDALFIGIAVARPKRSRDYLDLMADVTAEHSL